MKVLHLVKTSSGAFWALRQMRELVKCGIEVHVAFPFGGRRMHLYEEAGIIMHEVDFSVKNIFKSCIKLKRIINDIAPDIIHSHFFITTLIMRLVGLTDKRPRIFQVAGPLHLEHNIFRFLDVNFSKKNDYWIGTCKWTVNRYLKSGIPEDRVFLSYIGNVIEHEECQKDVIRKEYGLSKDDIIIAMIAYMYPPKGYIGQTKGVKGHEDFIDAISLLKKEYPNIYGVCIGGVSGGGLDKRSMKYEKKLKKYGTEKCGNQLIFMGTRHNIPELYADIDIAICASYSENLGGSSQAMIYKVPIISSNVGGLTDIVIDGKTGYLINPGKPLEIVDAVKKMLEDPQKTRDMVEAGYSLRMKLSNLDTYVQNTLDIYNKIT